MSSHDQDFAASALPNHLDYFGRTVRFIPKNGPERQLKAVLTGEGRQVEEGRIIDEEQQEIWCQVRRDESHADGGIANPQQGDAIIHPDESRDSTPFAYQGRFRNETPDDWELLFARNRRDAIRPRS